MTGQARVGWKRDNGGVLVSVWHALAAGVLCAWESGGVLRGTGHSMSVLHGLRPGQQIHETAMGTPACAAAVAGHTICIRHAHVQAAASHGSVVGRWAGV